MHDKFIPFTCSKNINIHGWENNIILGNVYRLFKSFTTSACLIRQIPLIPGLAHCVDKYKIYVSLSNF